MADKFIKGLIELTSAVNADWLIFQPNSASKIANRITVSNFLSSISHDYKTWYVNINGGDDGNTGGENDPFEEVQAAYDARIADGFAGIGQIKIMTGGTYAGLTATITSLKTEIVTDRPDVNLGGLTVTDVSKLYLTGIFDIGTFTINQTGTNTCFVIFEDCDPNSGVSISGTVNDFTYAEINAIGKTLIGLSIGFPDVTLNILEGARFNTSQTGGLSSLTVRRGFIDFLGAGLVYGSINADGGRILCSNTAEVEVTGTFTHAGVAFVRKEKITVSGTENDTTGDWANQKETIKIPIGARDTDHTTGTNKVGLHIDYDFEFIGLPTLEFDPIITDGGPTGTSFIVDINVADLDGTSLATILSTKLSVDAGEFHSSTAATPAVLSSNTIAQYKFISIDIDQIGGTLAGKGGFVTLNGFRI